MRRFRHTPPSADDTRYPRPLLVRLVRWLLIYPYALLLTYPAAGLFNLVTMLAEGASLTPTTLMQAFWLDHLIPLAIQNAPGDLALLVPAAAVVALLLFAGLRAAADRDNEQRVLDLREKQTHRAEVVHHARQEAGAVARAVVQEYAEHPPSAAPAEPQGPPFEEALLNPPPRFVGREEDLDWLLPRLRAGGTVGITALGGMGGIGKTALAAEAVRRLRAEGCFPDGVAVVLCAGLTDAAEVLRTVLVHVDPYRRAPDTADLAGLAAVAHRLLDGKDALIVLDNVEPALKIEQVVAPLRATGVTLLLTAREALAPAAVPADATRRLELLVEKDAEDLFAEYYGRNAALDLTTGERADVKRIVEALGRHTLAVKLAAAYAREQHRSLDALARDLADPRRALELLPDSDAPQAVKQSFASSYVALPSQTQRLFAALAAVGTAECGREAALALAQGLGAAESEAQMSVGTLVRWSLLEAAPNERMLEESDRERLRLHPLLLAFAQSLFATWSDDDRARASRTLATFYADYANATSVLALAPDDANIIHALDWAHAHGEDELVAELCSGMRVFWRDTGRTATSLHYLPWGVAAAEAALGAIPDAQHTEALAAWQLRAARLFYLLRDEGFAFQYIGDLEEAQRHYDRCLALARQAQNQSNVGAALSVLGQVAQARGRLEEAEQYYRESLAIRREVHDRRNEGGLLSSLGEVAQLRGRLEEAEQYYRESLAIRREVHDRRGEGVDLSNLGQIAQARGQLEEAEQYFQQGLAIDRDVQDRQGEGVDLSNLGSIAQARGQLEEAEQYFQQALAIFREVQARGDEGAVLSYLGSLAQARGRREEAEQYYQEGLAIRREVHDRRGEGVVLFQLALIAEASGDLDRAEALHRESLAIGIEVQVGQDVADSYAYLGQFLITKRNKPEEGCQMLASAAQLYDQMGMPGAEEARETARLLGCP
jgi:tetratricopeptide (TPR) repeat protein